MNNLTGLTDAQLDGYFEEEGFWEEEPNEEDDGDWLIEPWNLQSFEDSTLDWGPGLYPKGSANKAYFSVKNIWDDFAAPKGMGEKDSLIYELARLFPDVKPARIKRPLGEFKDLLHLSHEEIYLELCNRMMEDRNAADGRIMSYPEALWPYAQNLMRAHTERSEWLSEGGFYRGLSLMLYRSAMGIFLEAETSRLLTAKLEGSKLSKRFRYEEAPSNMENQDVDGLVIDLETEKPIALISVKTLGALTEKTVKRYREGKGKTKPDLYYGFKTPADGVAGRLSVISPDGRSLQQILKERIS